MRAHIRWAKWATAVASALLMGMQADAQVGAAQQDVMASLMVQRDYVQKRVSSYDRKGGNADAIQIAPGETATILDVQGPAILTHLWTTIATRDPWHLKNLVLRMYWDGETAPSVEAPIGDFFGLGLGQYTLYTSTPLAVGADKALNCWFQMPFQKSGRITVTNEGPDKIDAFYFNIDLQTYNHKLPNNPLYFHAQYRQAAPNKGWTNDWPNNYTPAILNKMNLNGEDNYVWMDAKGHGQYVGVTVSVVQNQDGWWGEGDDMFFVDNDRTPAITGTGTEDYFLGAWDFGAHSFAYPTFGAPVKGEELAGSRSTVYRFHLDSPIAFTHTMKATIEHGHANHRSDNFYSVAYWYQDLPHAPFPQLPTAAERIPRIFPTGGPGNAGGSSLPAAGTAH